MKVAKCNCKQTESKEPELLTFEQIKEREGVYQFYGEPYGSGARLIVLRGGLCIYLSNDQQWIEKYSGNGGKFLRTSETLWVGLKDADGKWVE